MEFNGWSSFEDLAKACGYTNSNSNSNEANNNNNNNNNNNSTNNSGNMGCCDIPNGFQALNPDLFVVIGEVLGNILAGNMPFNVQNAVGNWLQLVGQAIETYNAQQQYFQGGPGRYFNPKYYNVTNPFCNTTSTNPTQNSSSKANNKNSTSDSNAKSSSEDNVDKIKALELRINQLTAELEQIKCMLEK
ncbi:hypothetical protein [Clostridium sp. C2-6-12]|uniref:hypothetical protein n=1 Tax=Clostridium sp. C2-6-12 TaxID=2698832 RepID=UPI0013718A77|nr:hypothetical protein [Clostridium sp. C2-6-12]